MGLYGSLSEGLQGRSPRVFAPVAAMHQKMDRASFVLDLFDPFWYDPSVTAATETPRPVIPFSEDLAREICARVSAGESLRAICRPREMPGAATVHRWAALRPDFRRRLDEAQRAARMDREDVHRRARADRAWKRQRPWGRPDAYRPQVGETIYDGACGSAGFLCEAWEHLRRADLSAKDWDTLQRRTFYGQEKKSLAYVLGVMNMILHGIDAPNIRHVNTLAFENVMDIQQKDRHDIVLANPPFGGGERPEVQQNFPIRSSETAYLFLQHFIRKLKAGGRAAIVIKNTFLSNTDNASVELRRELLASCNLHTVLDCPGGTFQGAGVKTVVLFFEKGAPTRKTWYYQLDPGRSLGKTNPLNDADLAEFVALQKTFADSAKSWTVDAASVDQATFDMSVKNPNGGEVAAQRSPREILDEIAALDAESAQVLAKIRALV